MTLNFAVIWSHWLMLINGAWLTVQLALLATIMGFVSGSLCAIARRSRFCALRMGAATYIETIRNTPFLVQIFLVFFGLSSLGFSLSVFLVAILALIINVGAYSAEIIRAGFESIHKGQWEAAETLGLSKMQAYWHVAFLPAVERVYPALTSQFILLMLASSITSQISAEELTAAANFIQSETYRPFETYIITAVIYLILSLLMRTGFWLLGMLIFARRRRVQGWL